MPIFLRDGTWFGNLCATDTRQVTLNEEEKELLRNMALFLSYAIDLEHTAYTDSLTGIYSHSFLTELEQYEELFLNPFALFFIDIDDFKYVNDRFGHNAGDFVLQEFVHRINTLLSPQDFLLRFAGDEFLIVLPNISVNEMNDKGKSILEALGQPIYLQQHEIYLSASMGISMYPSHDETFTGLIQKADIAMYAAKQSGKNQFCIYSDYLERERKRQSNKIQYALEGQQNIIRLISDGASPDKILDSITRFVEDQTEGVCSILLYEKESETLSYRAGKGLPKDYIATINGIKVGPDAGSCGAAAYTKKQTIVMDIDGDKRWESFRKAAKEYGFRACWSTPILTIDQELLGTFAMYYKRPYAPTDREKELVERATFLVKLVLERERNKEELGQLLNMDPLTHLPNRKQFQNDLQHLCGNGKTLTPFAIFMLDIDEFNPLNLAFGYVSGDLILKKVACRLVRNFPKTATVYRVGGNEFAICLPCSQEKIPFFSKVLEDVFLESFSVSSHEVRLSVSYGHSLFPVDGQTPEDVTRVAMKDLLNKKHEKIALSPLQSTRMEEMERIVLTKDLYYAIERNELYLEYQPQHHIDTNKVIGFEALIRWKHPILGEIPPAKFVPLAEKTGLIIRIGNWVLKTACEELKRLHTAGYTWLRMGVNLSASQLKQPDFAAQIKNILSDLEIWPSKVDIEITESMMIEVERVLPVLQELHEYGVSISLDDFGTGYSSLGYLTKFPINQIKIDQSFIQRIGHLEDEMVIKTIIAMAQILHLNVIAEGVETEEQLTFLQQEQCNEVQGYLYSKPIPAAQLLNYMD
nr:EAL domain-containing protein [Mesobacillus campisalis]